MGVEIEHKFLVNDDSYRSMQSAEHRISQGYLSKDPERVVRIRTLDNKGYLTVKGRNEGNKRLEFEYEIPLFEARRLLTLCLPPIIEKIRHIVFFEGHKWEIDEYLGSLAPLVTAEIELSSSDEEYALAPFVGRNVTGDPRYYNSNL